MISRINPTATYSALAASRKTSGVAMDNGASPVLNMAANARANLSTLPSNLDSLNQNDKTYAQRSYAARYQGPAFHFSKGSDGFFQLSELPGSEESINSEQRFQLNQVIADSQRSKLELFTRSTFSAATNSFQEPQEPAGLQRYQQIASNRHPGELMNQRA